MCSRVALEQKGIELTRGVLVKVGIHYLALTTPRLVADSLAQHLEELTSLVDGHIDLRENLAASGRVPPVDPANSLTRIGVALQAAAPLGGPRWVPSCA